MTDGHGIMFFSFRLLLQDDPGEIDSRRTDRGIPLLYNSRSEAFSGFSLSDAFPSVTFSLPYQPKAFSLSGRIG